MTIDERDRLSAKRDRTARFYRVVRFLEGRGDRGATPEEIAAAVGMSKRTVYRDLKAIEEELLLPIWSEEGRYGLADSGLLPAFSLTREEAMAVFLSARLMARYADEYDPDLGAAFQKLAEGLPPVLARHIVDSVDALSQMRPAEPGRRSIIRSLTGAWADRRVVELRLSDGDLRRPKRHPPGAGPALPDRALADDPGAVPHRLRRDSGGGPDIQDQPDRIGRADPRPIRAARRGGHRGSPWRRPGTSSRTNRRRRSGCASRARSPAGSRRRAGIPARRSRSNADGSLIWRATVAGIVEIRSWILGWGADVEVLEPADLRAEVRSILDSATRRYAAG